MESKALCMAAAENTTINHWQMSLELVCGTTCGIIMAYYCICLCRDL